ncbi:MAG TPA: hypothetical protein PKN57_05575 [Saprospiraceae bacterium]|nr:cbb3-type cytochrome c oxidase subunit 3 [Saprospiraceae bacterium]MCC6687960.1 cbb3-type cytochrome c oxidase subunit 3 [Saprospiraceae bacterium]HMV22729.1 hypothetical protein [Saprospiraceae bacterium]HMW74195.1 hypothetical protein [Saprospiraceae bacterium]HMX81732.1 hypothetical protein [Saprospiraceae bacterium]
MKFVHYLERIVGVDIYPLLSLVIFGSFFLVVAVWLFSTKKSDFDEVSRIPLNENEPEH